MRSKKQIEAKYKKYKILDNPKEMEKKGLYQGPAPLTEWVRHRDVGFKNALEWVLEIKTAGDRAKRG